MTLDRRNLVRHTCLAAAVAGLAALSAMPAAAQDRYQRESCYHRDQDATTGGAVTGAIVGGVAAGPAGAAVGAIVGGNAGDDSVHCRAEGGYNDGRYYETGDDGRGYDRGVDDNSGYRQGYRDGYSDGSADASGRRRAYVPGYHPTYNNENYRPRGRVYQDDNY